MSEDNFNLDEVVEISRQAGEVASVSMDELCGKLETIKIGEVDPNIDINKEYAMLLAQINQTVETSLVVAGGSPSILMMLERLFNIKLKTIDSIRKHQKDDKVFDEDDDEDTISQDEYIENLRRQRKMQNKEKFGIEYGEDKDGDTK